jgi:alkylation response protein AidB-like acyl-CoA dehydrogenase
MAVDSGAAPGTDVLLAEARRLRPVLAARREQTDKDRCVPKSSIDELKAAGLTRLLQPRSFGGQQGTYDTFIRITEELAYGCPSTAWVYSVFTEHMWVLASYPEATQFEVWGNDPTAVASSSLAPRAVAEPVSGGFRLGGKWSFSSGCDHAEWMIVGAFVPASDGSREVYYMLVPRRDLIIDDDWYVLGLGGTGSKSLVLDDVFIPEEHALSEADLGVGRPPGAPAHPTYDLLRAPRAAFAPLTLPPVLLSLAEQASALVAKVLAGRVSRGVKQADLETTQLRFAKGLTEIRAARTTLYAVCEESTRRSRAGEWDSTYLVSTRADLAFCCRQLREAVMGLCDLTGGSWAYNRDPLQQVLRDMLTASSHRIMQWESAAVAYGGVALQ